MDGWLRLLKQKDKRTIARLITKIEDGSPEKNQLLEKIFPETGKTFLIGLTGPPGAGKSSLIDGLITKIRQVGLSVGVIAVDPTSPFTGGAMLGDRVRMTKHALDTDVFIRSMGSRGNVGGLSRSTREAVRVLDAAGFDVVLIETVGVGQAELEIMHLADTVLLVLNPGAGDIVQVFKAGIMEIADLFVVNKADLSGANRLVTEIEELLDLQQWEWRPPIVQTIASLNQGISECWSQIIKHRQHLEETGEWVKRRQNHLRQEVLELLEDSFYQFLKQEMKKPEFEAELEQVALRRKVPHQVARIWLNRILFGKKE
ncbi:methylmalonyl Co-A mutase-associated GTPase MeaB [Thermoflavimicrobium daqui]|uniref:Methylmalonyl Co-A mutase-associated GTPase MeaB n=1 Tax=Thermoflavimicrobium daqui TaxID=2137476 RepID=A0A364K3D7_9BACL|nr:methylmalonyl Co-A mutase-associated GTPase MeaB [Thermoflavimicrobium daqui]RAL23351.1 methylmalonyl Co-A mutase-associated GTPase MeaB [Thermoflavimicrobium daqui]